MMDWQRNGFKREQKKRRKGRAMKELHSDLKGTATALNAKDMLQPRVKGKREKPISSGPPNDA